nr:mannitol-1-phosphate 5-dehydrogenase [Petrimonas sp.]
MEKKSILIFGAGKIGRSFIGQLFGLSGYEVVFSDIDVELVALLNLKKSYNIVIKGDKEER